MRVLWSGRGWLARGGSECTLGTILLRYPFIWPPFAASFLNLGSSCCEEEEERRLLGNICRSLITCRTGRRRRRPRAAAPAGEDLPGPREGVRALRRFAPKRKLHPATGATQRPRESLIMAPRRPRAPGGTSWPRGGI